MPDAAEFDSLSAEFYEGWFHFHPDLALRLGVPVTGRLLPARDADELAALRGWLEELLLGLDEIAFTALDAARQLDWELMAGAARVEYRELVQCEGDGPDPLQLLPLAEIDWLARGRVGPPEALVRLLRELPGHLRQAQAQLRAVASGLALPLIRTAAAQARGGCTRLRELGHGPLPRHGQQDLEALLEAAAEALAGYGRYLTEELVPRARGPLGCGADHLGLRLREVHFIDCDPAADDGPIERVLRAAEQALGDPESSAGPTATPPPSNHTAASPAAQGLGGGDPGPADDPIHPRRLPRRLANAVSLTEGWSLYQSRHPVPGEVDRRPLGLAARRERLLCARLDLDLHRGRCDGDQALAALYRHGCEGPAADALLAQIARHPGDALAAVLGWRLLEQVHGQQGAVAGLGAGEFHDRLFSLGAIPLPLVLRYAFDQALWQGVGTAVFGAEPLPPVG